MTTDDECTPNDGAPRAPAPSDPGPEWDGVTGSPSPGGSRKASRPRLHPDIGLFMIGVATLFVELALIRWLGTEVRVFAYFKNLALIACFFGSGLGCLVGARLNWARAAFYPALLLIVASVAIPKAAGWDLIGAVNRLLAELNDMPLWAWGQRRIDTLSVLSALAFLIVAFLLLALAFVPLGSVLGDRLQRCGNLLRGYSANVAGSLVGVVLFDGFSYFSLPPIAWFLASCLLGWIIIERRRELWVALCSATLIGALLLPRSPGAVATVWSPYQKLTMLPQHATSADGESVLIGYTLQVNETSYQRVANLAYRFLRSHSDLFPEAPYAQWIGYDLAYRVKEHPDDVLVVGAGTGNDVAAALRNGAGRVDAVEIDPRIVDLGRRFHPEHPYADRRVHVIVDDARSYLKRSTRTYDLIVFGALDSHTLNSTLSNLRVDNYVYTVQAFQEARARLKPDGVLWLLFAIERPYIAERLYGMLAEAFGRPPIVFNNRDVARLSPSGGGTTFVIDRDGTVGERIDRTPSLAAIVGGARVYPVARRLLPTDDWPYLYVAGRSIPNLYLIVMGIIVVIALILVRPYVTHLRRIDPHFFLLGAAFLLLEVQSISRMALVFGNTWVVNAIVISSVLVMILLANLAAPRFSDRALVPAFGCLFASLAVSYLFPTRALLEVEGVARWAAAGALVGLPILFAGLIFALTFRSVSEAGLALGSNLLGAIIGGACESASFLVGLNALVLLALLLYAGSFVTLLLRRGGTPIPA
ncbi:MAG TPA: methyltransferase domain-containing protein [Thermoanaerobaculaceae bacterium]|nr:methyltransferase domain-containing protein [Thermoanaerobaculaceae bacterium]